MKYTNIIYFSYLNTIGGIETWLYNLSVLYKNLDITVIVNKGSRPQIDRLRKNVRVIEWDGKQRFECERLFVNFNRNIIPFVTADKIYCVLHGDYEDMLNRKQLTRDNLPLDPSIDEYIGITKLVCDSWERVTGIKATLCYNPVIKPEMKKTIRICSAQRMSKEKGRQRIELLANALEWICGQGNYNFIWDIYTDERKPIKNNNVFYKQPRLDVSDFYTGYDWFVALSDNEGYCYSVVENLCRGVPCVVTDLPVFKELGLDDSNSLTCDMAMSNALDIAHKMFSENKVFKYQPPADVWGEMFGENKSTYYYKEENIVKHKVVALETYSKLNIKDAVLDKVLPEGFVFEVEDSRLDVLLGKNAYKKPFVKLYEEPAEEKVAEEPAVKVEEEPVVEAPKVEEPKKRGRKKKQ